MTMDCPLHNNPPHSGKCTRCGAIFVTPERLEEIAAIRDATDGMTYTELLQWTAKQKIA